MVSCHPDSRKSPDDVYILFYMEGKYSMRKKMTSKVMSVALAAAMAMSLAACANTGTTAPATDTTQPADTTTPVTDTTDTTDATQTTEPVVDEPVEEVEPYTVITNADGSPIDLGGIEIIQRDWWTNPDDYFMTNPKNDYDEARKEYVEWAQEKYNFTFKEQAISDWGSTPQDFIDYVSSGGDENNYLWVIRDDPSMASAMANGLMYDLSTLDCLDFSEEIFTLNKVHEQYTYKGGIYAMYTGLSEPRDGLFINEQILKDANVDVNEIYDAQANGTWTWDKLKEIMDKVQQDTDNDGTFDVWGITGNVGGWARTFACSNGGEFVGNSSDGYVYRLEDPQTVEGVNFAVELMTNYYMPRPVDPETGEAAPWDYYKEEFINGTVAFGLDGFYAGAAGGQWADVTFPVGFVMVPKGPSGEMINIWSNNPYVIPSCYDADTAWKIACAYYIYNQAPAGYEDYNGHISRARSGVFDDRACDETVPMMSEAAHGMITFDGMIPGLETGPQFTWNIYAGCDVSAAIESAAESWKTFVDTANGK